MKIYDWLILACWLVFWVVWAVSGLRAKRNVKSGWVWRREIGLRFAIAVLVLLAVGFLRISHNGQVLRYFSVNRGPLAGRIGTALCAAGIGLAILARMHLGRNWGMPMSHKENPELVTSGPYAAIRHPIYTGILLGALGSAIGQSTFWAVAFVVLTPYFIYSARREEKLMIEQFPDQYPAYMKRTKMLLPYVL